MKALSVIQPWPWCIIHGKCVDNRSWHTDYRGPLAIHASAKRSVHEAFDAQRLILDRKIDIVIPSLRLTASRRGFRITHWPEELPTGAIVAYAELVDCVTHHTSPWFVGKYGFVIADVRPLTVPIPAKGRLGLWDWNEAPQPTAQLTFPFQTAACMSDSIASPS